MVKKIFKFGETVQGYDRLVLNEREARAAAGILFIFAFMSFLYAYKSMDFRYTKIFITFFMVDFIIRVLINPKYAPSLILGRMFVFNQQPEYVSATPKRFAWSIGLVLSVVMFILVAILEMMHEVKIYICLLCLVLLYFEAVFGICLGCIMYNLITRNSAKYCPGNVCEDTTKQEVQKFNLLQIIIALVALSLSSYFVYQVIS